MKHDCVDDSLTNCDVTPYTGVWIETFGSICFHLVSRCHSLYGSVD